ncbi:uncharacterized protein LOC112668725 isoform X8 [Canis lupus dingo]|uniref:uncharacterized protein LOC102154740 isoform X8 n=2 Tax=Canis lupus familiaris TaxID=9615 RepID=UPI000DC6CFBA|nr:uncharacterized protein LOC102154740 isoform X8 [Canis lupus familiaris]XP_048956094.1 uncharacterized protein LOC112668725 isoform X8 [Canis lupus dingo]
MQNKHRSPGFRLVSRLSAALYRYRSTVPPASPRPLVPVEVCGVTRDLANLTSCRQMRPLLVWGLRPGPDLPRGPVGVLGAQRETSLSAGPEPSVGSAPHGNGRGGAMGKKDGEIRNSSPEMLPLKRTSDGSTDVILLPPEMPCRPKGSLPSMETNAGLEFSMLR